MDTAEKTTAIVSSLFPSNVRDRIMEEAALAEDTKKEKENKKTAFLATTTRKADITGYSPSEAIFGSRPIADLVGIHRNSYLLKPNHRTPNSGLLFPPRLTVPRDDDYVR